MPRLAEIFVTFLRLGCTSFGGPVAHLAYFEAEFVRRKAWLDHETFAECIAVSQLLPGPGSSQTGMLVGWLAGGPFGAFAAWVGFTLPSAVLMTALALTAARFPMQTGWMHGLLLVAAAAVASAIVTMRASLAPDLPRMLLALAVAAFVFVLPSAYATPVAIAASAIIGALFFKPQMRAATSGLHLPATRGAAVAAIALFALTFVVLAWAARYSHLAMLANALFTTGSLVFGGGHVVLPIMQQQLATSGMISSTSILSGYAAAQAMPGPLFSISSYVGASAFDASLGVLGAIVATVAIFAPSFFLLAAIAPFYSTLAANARFRAALSGASAGVIGLLVATFVNPIFISAIHTIVDGAIALLAFCLLQLARAPAWAIVVAGAAFGYFVGK